MSHRGSLSVGDLVFKHRDGKPINKQLHFISCTLPKNNNNSNLNPRSRQTTLEEGGRKCSPFKWGAFFLEFCFKWGASFLEFCLEAALSRAAQGTLQNLWVSESSEVPEIHCITAASNTA